MSSKGSKFGKMISRMWVVNPNSMPYVQPKQASPPPPPEATATMQVPETEEYDIEFYKKDHQPGPLQILYTLKFDKTSLNPYELIENPEAKETPSYCDHVPRPEWLHEREQIVKDAIDKDTVPVFGRVMKWEVKAIGDDKVEPQTPRPS